MSRKPFIASSIRRMMVVDSPDGMPRAVWDDSNAIVRRVPPSHACTVTAFDDKQARDEHMASLIEQRDNAAVHTVESPPKGGPYVTLTVHWDRPSAPDDLYEDVVTVICAGRGRTSGTIEDGIDAWSKVIGSDNIWSFALYRRVEGGYEVANSIAGLDLWMEPDLADRLRVVMADFGMSFAGGTYVSAIIPTGDWAHAVSQFARKFHSFGLELERILFAVHARQRGRLFADDPAAMRILKRLAEGGVLMWSLSIAKRLPSFQLRLGDMEPYKVSGETIDLIFALGLADTLWRPADGGRFPSAQWHLLTISETGLRFLHGDVPAGVLAARQDREIPSSMWRLKPMPFVDSIEAYAATLSPETREAIHGGISLPRSFDIAKRADAIGAQNALSMVLIGMLSGKADVTEDGRFKTRKP